MKKQPGYESRSGQARIEPMTGEEVEMLYGDSSLKEREQAFAELGRRVDELSRSMEGESDADVLQGIKEEIQETREQMRFLDREIRAEQKRFGGLRGEVRF